MARIKKVNPLSDEWFAKTKEDLDRVCSDGERDMDWSAQKRWIEDKVNRAKSIPIRGQVKS